VAGGDGSRLPQRKLTFRYPTALPAIQLFGCIFMLAVFWVVYWGDVPLKGGWSLVSFSVLWLFVGCTDVWVWGLSLWRRTGLVTLDTTGISIGKRSLAWENITKISHPRFFARGGALVRLEGSAPKVGFFDLRASFRTQGRPIYMRGYPFVYRDVMPIIVSVRPDLEVPAVVRRLMDDPERAMEPRGWLVLFVLAATAALLAAAARTYAFGVVTHLSIASGLLCLPGILRFIAVPWTKDARAGLAGAALSSPLLVGAAMFAVFLGMGNYAGLQALIAASLAMVLAAAVVVLLVKRFHAGRQVALAFLMLAAPAVVYAGIRSAEWPATNLTQWAGEVLGVIWGEDGLHATAWICEDPPPVLHLPSMTEVPVPGHGGSATVCWLGKRHLVRRVKAAGGDELWVFDLERKTESRLPTADKWTVSRGWPVDAEGRRLVWLDCDAEWRAKRLRTWNLAARREERAPIAVPPDMQNLSCSADWIDADKIGVCGKDAQGVLHVLRVNVLTSQAEAMASAHRYGRWLPIEGFEYAFGLTEQEEDKYSLTWVNLKTDRAVPLDGTGGYPGVAADAGCSFRVRSPGGKQVLSRFDFATAQETTVCRVPGYLGLAGVGRSGQTVLLGPAEDLLGMPRYLVVDVATGKTHAIHLTGMGTFSSADYLASMPNRSPLSPDGRRIILMTLRPAAKSEKTVLCTVPPNWP